MKQNKLLRKNVFVIDHLEGTFSQEEIDRLNNQLDQINYSLRTKPHKMRYIMGLEDLFAQITISIPPDIIQTLILGIATNGIYDCVKAFFVNVWRIIKTKKFLKLQHGKVEENATPIIHVQAGAMKIVIPADLDEKKFEYFVDKMFESINAETVCKENYAVYDVNSGRIMHYTEKQIAQKAYWEWKVKQHERENENEGFNQKTGDDI